MTCLISLYYIKSQGCNDRRLSTKCQAACAADQWAKLLTSQIQRQVGLISSSHGCWQSLREKQLLSQGLAISQASLSLSPREQSMGTELSSRSSVLRAVGVKENHYFRARLPSQNKEEKRTCREEVWEEGREGWKERV